MLDDMAGSSGAIGSLDTTAEDLTIFAEALDAATAALSA